MGISKGRKKGRRVPLKWVQIGSICWGYLAFGYSLKIKGRKFFLLPAQAQSFFGSIDLNWASSQRLSVGWRRFLQLLYQVWVQIFWHCNVWGCTWRWPFEVLNTDSWGLPKASWFDLCSDRWQSARQIWGNPVQKVWESILWDGGIYFLPSPLPSRLPPVLGC